MIRKSRLESIYSQHKNNGTRKIFKQLLTEYGWDVVFETRPLVRIDGEVYGFSVSPDEKAVCRQFYDDCVGLITYSVQEGKVYVFDRDELKVQDCCNRITPRGVSAYTATSEFDEGVVVYELA